MGLIISRFRKKQSTKEILEQIQQDVLEIEEYHVHTQQRQKWLVGSLVLYSIVLYLVAAVLFYFYYFPSTLNDQLLYATPFIVFPLVVYILKRLLTWYYRRKISKNEQKLKSLRERKAKILEQVMETETYKVAKEILETYAPDQLHRSQMHKTPAVITPAPQRLPTPSSTHPDVRRRIVPPLSTPQSMAQLPLRPMGAPNLPHQTPIFPVRAPLNSQSTPRPGLTGMSSLRSSPPGPVSMPPGSAPKYSATPAQSHHTSLARLGPGPGPVPGLGHSGGEGPPGPPMPRPVLPRERGYLDRFVEYLVGDGPANRFALVCRQCESHNGMALKDEFQYLAFRCAYCFYWNPARKQRPFAPRLETIAPHLPPPVPVTEDQEEEEDEEEEEQEEQESSSGEDEEEEEGGVEEDESGSSSSAEDEEEEEGAVSSSELSSNKATSSQEGVCRPPQQAGSVEDVAKSTPSSDRSSSDDHQNFVEVFYTSSSVSRTNHTITTSSSASSAASPTSSSNTATTPETEE